MCFFYLIPHRWETCERKDDDDDDDGTDIEPIEKWRTTRQSRCWSSAPGSFFRPVGRTPVPVTFFCLPLLPNWRARGRAACCADISSAAKASAKANMSSSLYIIYVIVFLFVLTVLGLAEEEGDARQQRDVRRIDPPTPTTSAAETGDWKPIDYGHPMRNDPTLVYGNPRLCLWWHRPTTVKWARAVVFFSPQFDLFTFWYQRIDLFFFFFNFLTRFPAHLTTEEIIDLVLILPVSSASGRRSSALRYPVGGAPVADPRP